MHSCDCGSQQDIQLRKEKPAHLLKTAPSWKRTLDGQAVAQDFNATVSRAVGKGSSAKLTERKGPLRGRPYSPPSHETLNGLCIAPDEPHPSLPVSKGSHPQLVLVPWCQAED